LKDTRAFNAVYRRADATWHTPYFVLFYRKSDQKRVGFVAGKKVGKAVARNRAKRLLRAQFLLFVDRLEPGEYVWVAKPELLEKPFTSLTETVDHALHRIGALTRKKQR